MKKTFTQKNKRHKARWSARIKTVPKISCHAEGYQSKRHYDILDEKTGEYKAKEVSFNNAYGFFVAQKIRREKAALKIIRVC